MHAGSARQSGFTYVMLLVAVALIGIGLARAGQAYSERHRRAQEAELLWVAGEFIRAIETYYQDSPGTGKVFPRSLNDLLEDTRFATLKRHLRKVYPDPLTRSTEWGLVTSPQAGISGIYSRSESAPLTHVEIEVAGQRVRPASRYADWKFVYLPPATEPR